MPQVKFLFGAPEFFRASPKKLKVEADPIVGRTYFILNGRIVGVAELDR